MKRIVKANLLAGVLPGLLAPILWPVVVYLSEGAFPNWEIYPMAAMTISFFAVIIGLSGCLVLGVPSLLCLEKLKVNTPLVAAAVGCLLAFGVFYLVRSGQARVPVEESWPVYAFVGILGASCGFAASCFSRPDNALQPTAGRGG